MNLAKIPRVALVAALVLAPAVHAEGVRVPAFTESGDLAVLDLKAEGIGSGKAPAETAAGRIVVDVAKTKLMPSGVLLVGGDGQATHVLDLMGSSLVDMNNFDQRLAAQLAGRPLPPIEEVVLIDSTPRPSSEKSGGTPFSPSSGLASRGGGKPGKDRPVHKRDNPPANDGGGDKPTGKTFHVMATAEGLIGGHTASGLVIQKWTEGSALPSRTALGRTTHITYSKNSRSTACKVSDVGPWNINDPYWEHSGVPQAASGTDNTGRRTNKAGIDIMNGSWYKLLGLHSYDIRTIESTSGMVTWGFQ